jgi:hypothetical protein
MNCMILLRSFVLAILVVTLGRSLGSAQDAEGVALPPREQFHLFLLAGQSNMAGRGKVPQQDRQPHERVLALDEKGQWVPAIDPLHHDKPSAGVGLGRSFAIMVAEAHPDVTIGLIPAAAGGSPIAAWQPEGYHDQTKSHPYDEALERTRRAMQQGTLKGILWHQGESDSHETTAKVYEQKLHELIARFREEFDNEELPFVAGQMGRFDEQPWDHARKQVDAAHRQLVDNVPHTAFVSSDGLKHKGDQVHFDAASYRELGRRYAKAYLALEATRQE